MLQKCFPPNVSQKVFQKMFKKCDICNAICMPFVLLVNAKLKPLHEDPSRVYQMDLLNFEGGSFWRTKVCDVYPPAERGFNFWKTPDFQTNSKKISKHVLTHLETFHSWQCITRYNLLKNRRKGNLSCYNVLKFNDDLFSVKTFNDGNEWSWILLPSKFQKGWGSSTWFENTSLKGICNFRL